MIDPSLKIESPAPTGKRLTPMMKQYELLRNDLPPGTLLLFRLGDFYELFFDDALQAAPILNVALTKRGEIPMCGIPYHSAQGYLRKLLAAGKRVALCEQVGEVQTGKLVERKITRILSPGTLEDIGLEEGEPNFIAAILPHKKKHASEEAASFGLAYVDLSTGTFSLTELWSYEALLDEVTRLAPAEIIAPRKEEKLLSAFKEFFPLLQLLDDDLFDQLRSYQFLCSHFQLHSLDGLGANELPHGMIAAGGLLDYLSNQLRRDVTHLSLLKPYHCHDYLLLDAATQSHLELVHSRAGRARTLLGVLDRSRTPMGSRLLRDWILHPLRDQHAIDARQEVLAILLREELLLGELREELRGVGDIERALSRLSQNSASARDLVSLKNSLSPLPRIKEKVTALLKSATSEQSLLEQIKAQLHDFSALERELSRALLDDPPATTKEGGMIRDGFHELLDEYRLASREGKNWMAALQSKEIEQTGIKSLKIRFNALFGYFIEVTKANLNHVPQHYIRKQTTVHGERFITSELKEMEEKILSALERSKILEFEIFGQLRSHLLSELKNIQQTAAAIAMLDLFSSLAEVARLYRYTRPVINNSKQLSILDGRHPVLEQQEKQVIPNDTQLDGEEDRMAIITGPNMAGKSTYLKQNALLTLMAQMGSYVPASKMSLGIVDRLFTRVGASDDLSRGQSTFMVEMNETAKILHHATSHSLVLLDEIGRGTATFDGLSIAWSVAEYLYDITAARTMFATHYHELPDLARTRKGVKNLHVAVQEAEKSILFLHKILPGAASRSYGIEVARLAGLPSGVLERAQEILANLEKAELNAEGRPQLAISSRLGITRRRSSGKHVLDEAQMLFEV